LFWADVLPFWLLLALAFLFSVFNAPGDLARRALVPTLAGWAAMPLERANAADTAIPRLSQLVGPLIGGILVAVAGAPTVLLLDAATFLLSAAAVAVAVPSSAQVDDNRRAQRSDAHGQQVFADSRLMRSPARQYLSELREGFRFVRTSGLLISLIVIATVASLLEKPLMSVVAPVYAQDNYGSAASFGAMLSAFGAGALVGTVAFSVIGPRLPRRLTFLTCFLIWAVDYLVLAAMPPFPVTLAALALGGLAVGPLNPLLGTLQAELVPPKMRGRVYGAISAGAWAAIPAGILLGGVAADAFGVSTTFLVIGVCYIAVAAYGFRNEAFREMDRQPEPVAAPVA
jgi:predicted MFS family arabinose efflux permease